MLPRAGRLVLSLGLTLMPVLLPVAAVGGDAVLPLSEVRAGMEGKGRTVFEGARVEEFGVRILGVLENALGPKQSLILARLDGGPLAQTGVIEGMSGSPVFVDGKLVGAVAYAFPFGKEPIAGITPIGEMVDATQTTAPRAASARFRSAAASGLRMPLDRESVKAALRRPLRGIVPAAAPGVLPASLEGATLNPLALPLVFSGFDGETFEWARGLFASMGFAPRLGGSASSSSSLGPMPDLEPGAAVGISLIEGDIDVSVTGTITHIDHDRVYAFGHPFYNLGPTQFPMKKAWVYSVFPSLQSSWKIAAATDAVGTMDQDRATAVAGRLGAVPRMIPVTVNLRSRRGPERTFRYRMVEDELFTPVLGYVSLLSILHGNERAYGAATLRVTARVALGGGREVRVDDVVAAEQPAQEAAGVLAGPLALLVGNDFEKVELERLDVDVEAEEELRQASLTRVWIDAPEPLRPGSTVPLKVQLRTHRGEAVTRDLTLALPASAPSGTYTLLVGSAAVMDAVEQREMRQAFAPRDLPALVQALNKLRSGSHVYARLTRPGAGAVVGGEYLPALPASVLSVLGSSDQGTNVVPLASTPVWRGDVATDYAVTGLRQVTVVVRR
jgi:hypothetical protein